MSESKVDLTPLDPEVDMLEKDRMAGFKYQERRHRDWTLNYTLSRGHVELNELTQRQSVDLPFMKTVQKTVMKDIDDMPVIYFENLDNDKRKEIFQNEYWKYTLEVNNAEIQDIVDKKLEFNCGRTFSQWQVVDGKIKWTVVEPEDIYLSDHTDPTNIHSSRFLIHNHIYVPLTQLEQNSDYDQEKIKELKAWYATKLGLIKAKDNEQSASDKAQKMSDLGYDDAFNPIVGEVIVEITLHFRFRKEEGDDEEKIYLYVLAENNKILMKKKIEDVIGKTKDHWWRNHYPYDSWASDVDAVDVWTDGTADVIRTTAIIINAWSSQIIENRTLKNLNMNIYDAGLENFVPQTWEPRAWGMYGLPVPEGKTIQDVFFPMPVGDLSNTLPEMQFLIEMAEKGSGATATQQGVQTERKVTLGEVELALNEAKERLKGISKFYTKAWHDRSQIFLKLIEAASDKLDAVKIYKKGINSSSIYTKEIVPADWMSELGYTTRIWNQNDKDSNDLEKLKKINGVKANMPDNPIVDDAFKRGMLEFIGLSPDKVNEAMQYEESKKIANVDMQNNNTNVMMNNRGRMSSKPAITPDNPGQNQLM